jgi:hypothetical protein
MKMKILNRTLPLNQTFINATGCCPTMDQQLNYKCLDLAQHGLECPDIVIRKNSDYEYTLWAVNVVYSISYCPWCGLNLNEKSEYERKANRKEKINRKVLHMMEEIEFNTL